MTQPPESDASEAVPQAKTAVGGRTERYGGINPLRVLLWLAIGILALNAGLLWHRTQALEADLTRLRARNASTDASIQAMQRRIDMLEKRMPVEKFQITHFSMTADSPSDNNPH